MTKAQAAERQQAIEQLRGMLSPGATVYTVLDHVSTSGMSRAIRVVVPYTREDGTIDHLHPNWAVGKALQLRHWKRNGREQDALVLGGCGMDMGFHLVYELSHTLYGARLVPDVYQDAATEDQPGGQLLTREGAPAGSVYLGGYKCLGQGKCPSNYHCNHRDRVRCPGHEGRICWKPGFGSRFPIPEDWPEADPIAIGDGATIPGGLLAVLHTEHEGAPYEVCPTCKGAGDLANPEGPERWDLVHTDGYALRHRWL